MVADVDVVDEVAGQVRDDRHARWHRAHGRRDRRQLVQDRIHQRRVEGVRDLQLPGPVAGRLRDLGDLVDRLALARDHDRVRAVDRRDRDVGLLAGDPLLGLLQRPVDGQHLAACRQATHQPTARHHEPSGVFEAEDARDTGRRDLADAVADHEVGLDAPVVQQLGQRVLDGEQARLGVARVAEQVSRRDPETAPRRAASRGPRP